MPLAKAEKTCRIISDLYEKIVAETALHEERKTRAEAEVATLKEQIREEMAVRGNEQVFYLSRIRCAGV